MIMYVCLCYSINFMGVCMYMNNFMWIKDDNKPRSNNSIMSHTMFVRQWEPREREREMFHLPIKGHIHAFLRIIGLLKFYEEDIPIMGNSFDFL